MFRSLRPSTSTEPETEPEAERAPIRTAAALELAEALRRLRKPAVLAYAAHGLPLEPGFYARRMRGWRWTRLSDDLTAEERMDLLLNPPGSGLRVTRWEDLGERTAPNWPDLVDASRLLRAISRIEARVADGDDGLIADLRLALGVGALAQNLAQRLIAGRVFGCFCGTFSSALTLAMQARRREELGSFPGPPPTGSACPASGQTPPDGAARSQPPAPSAV